MIKSSIRQYIAYVRVKFLSSHRSDIISKHELAMIKINECPHFTEMPSYRHCLMKILSCCDEAAFVKR